MLICLSDQLINLFQAIQRLSKDNVRLRQNSFRIMNNVYTPAENIKMQEKLKIFREAEKRLDHIFLNIGTKTIITCTIVQNGGQTDK